MVYAVVSKTTSRKAVWVRLPPCPHLINMSEDNPIDYASVEVALNLDLYARQGWYTYDSKRPAIDEPDGSVRRYIGVDLIEGTNGTGQTTVSRFLIYDPLKIDALVSSTFSDPKERQIIVHALTNDGFRDHSALALDGQTVIALRQKNEPHPHMKKP